MKKIIFLMSILLIMSGCFDKNLDKLNELKKVSVESVTISNASIMLTVGEEITLTATILPSDSKIKDISWSSSDTKIATVDAAGKVTAVTIGTVVITVTTTDGGKTAICNVTVNVSVAGVTLNASTLTLIVGDTEILKAVVSPENATDKSVAWTSSNPSVATVDESGKVTAIEAGTAVITVTTTDGKKSATCAVKVESATIFVTGVSLNKSTMALVLGNTEILTAAISPEDATNKTVNWMSSNTSVAKVDKTGRVTGLEAGMAVIIATTEDGGKMASCTVTVIVTVAAITLDKDTLTLTEGEDANLTANVTPNNATNKEVKWYSNNINVATVDAGKVKALTEGTTTISAITVDGNKTAECLITVKKKIIAVESVKIDKSEVTLYVNETITLISTVEPANATNKQVSWAVSNNSIATVDTITGKVTAITLGKTEVQVVSADGQKSATCVINILERITPVSGVILDKQEITLEIGADATLTATVNPSNATNKAVKWSSSNINIATVNAGKVKAIGKGTATISVTAVDGGNTSSCIVTVNAVSVTGVSLNKNETTLTVDVVEILSATVSPVNATNKNVTWISSNTSVATVDEIGKVTAIGEGTSLITVATVDGAKRAVCTVTVNMAMVSVTGVSLNKSAITLNVGNTEVLTATVSPENASNKSVGWSSNNTNVARVDSSGKVVTVGAGTALIIATTTDGGKIATCTVTVTGYTPIATKVVLIADKSSIAANNIDTAILTAKVYDQSDKEMLGQAITYYKDSLPLTSNEFKSAAQGTYTFYAMSSGRKSNVVTVIANAITVSVTGVSLNKSALPLTVGGIDTLTYTISPTNATNKSVSWISNNTSVATVDSNGKVIAIGAGTAIITVTTTDGQKTMNCTVTVTANATTVSGVTLNKSTMTLEVRNTEILTATITPSNAKNKSINWTSNNTTVATVDNNGKVTAVGLGIAVIIAATVDGGKIANCTVTVSAFVTGVSLNKSTTILAVGDTETLMATVNPENATNKSINWTSSNTNVATVDNNGKIMAVGEGTAVINAATADGGKTASCTVNVVIVNVTGLSLNKSTITLTVWNTETLIATISPFNATNTSVNWTSNNTSVAKVDSTGKVTPVGLGTAVVIAATADGGKTASCTVTVNAAPTPVMILVSANGNVTIANDFYIGKYEVTQLEFQSAMGFNPSYFTDKAYNPVEQVTWYDAVMYCNNLSEKEGLNKYYNITNVVYYASGNTKNIESATVTENAGAKGYRLPTSMEWEYAARGGKSGMGYTYSGSNTIGDVAWYTVNAWDLGKGSPDYGTHPVGTKATNELGIYDMSGNVEEWCQEWYQIGYDRIYRGGSWGGSGDFCAVSYIGGFGPHYRPIIMGFRVCRSVYSGTLTNISITSLPVKTNYNIGETLDITGLIIKGTYSDGSTKQESVSAINITGFDSTTVGTKTLTITAGGKVTSCTVTVNAKIVPPGMVRVTAGTTSANNGNITVANDFYIGKYEVTQGEFQSLMGFNPSYFTGNTSNNPVEKVTWYDALAYLNAKSTAEGLEWYYNISGITKDGNHIASATVTENEGAKGYRLPTEVEWEYAARGGKNGAGYTYSGSNTIGDVAWYRDNASPTNSDKYTGIGGTHPVGGKAANELGIYDMSGNVSEWCQDWYDGSKYGRVLRGGPWDYSNISCEVSCRLQYYPNYSDYDHGFRVCRF